MSAVVNVKNNTSRTLDRKAEPEEVIKESDVTDVPRLTRLLTRIVNDVAALKRRFVPRSTTFEEIVSDGDALSPFVARIPHRFGSRVEWSLVGPTSGGLIASPLIHESSESDGDTLVLEVFFPASLRIRVQEMG